jgi:hypothetical protein
MGFSASCGFCVILGSIRFFGHFRNGCTSHCSKPSLACSRLRWYVLCKKSKEMQSLFLVMSIVQVHAQDACRCRNIVDPEVMSGPRCERGW